VLHFILFKALLIFQYYADTLRNYIDVLRATSIDHIVLFLFRIYFLQWADYVYAFYERPNSNVKSYFLL